VSDNLKHEVDRKITELLRLGFIEPSRPTSMYMSVKVLTSDCCNVDVTRDSGYNLC